MPLRLLTANLLHVHADPIAFGDLLDREQPDVVGVQELGEACAAVLAERFEHKDLDPTDDPLGMGIASRHPASFSRLALEHTPGWQATLADGTRIVTVHVRNPVDISPLASNRERRRQIDAIVAHVEATSDRLVIMGDFNATPAWPAYRRLEAVLDDAVAVASGPQSGRLRTWGPRMLGGRKLLRIDHVFARGFEARAARVIEVPGSDHAAVVVDLA